MEDIHSTRRRPAATCAEVHLRAAALWPLELPARSASGDKRPPSRGAQPAATRDAASFHSPVLNWTLVPLCGAHTECWRRANLGAMAHGSHPFPFHPRQPRVLSALRLHAPALSGGTAAARRP